MQLVGKALVLVLVSWLARDAPSQLLIGQSDTADAFVLGVLRRDGIVSPFAAFDGKNWSAPWPRQLTDLDLPISLGGVSRKWWGKAEAPEEMALWSNGVRRGTVKLAQPKIIRIICETRLGLTSNYKSTSEVPSVYEQPYPKDGLVISGNQPIGAIESVPRSDPRWGPAAVGLIEPFDDAEMQAIRVFTAWKHPIPRAERRKVPVELEVMYRAPMDEPGWYAYYVEAVKRYPPGPDDENCGLVTSVSGFVITGPGKRSIKLHGQVSYCDRAGAAFMLPLGLMKVRGRSTWIYQISGYDRESYGVVQPTSSTISPLVWYSAGFCPR